MTRNDFTAPVPMASGRVSDYLPPKPAPFVGQPATIHLWTDSVAAVVVKVNPKSIVVDRVETGERTVDERCDVGAWGARPVRSEGILDRPLGIPQRFMLKGHREDGTPIYKNGSTGLSLGHSVTWTDYRN